MKWCWIVLLSVSVLIGGMPLSLAQDNLSIAQVQSERKRLNPLRFLFPRSDRLKQLPPASRVERQRVPRIQNNSTRVPSSNKAKRTPTKRRLTALPKQADAKRILVIGDDMASDLSQGLKHSYRKVADVEIIDLNQTDLGFSQPSFYKWLDGVEFAFLDERIFAIVIAIGLRDDAPITNGRDRAQFGSVLWRRFYDERVLELASRLQPLDLPIYWVSPLPQVDDLVSDRFYKIAQAQRSIVLPFDFVFVDMWAGFTDSDGQFITSGPGLSGKSVALRTPDGLGLTSAGQHKAAFYVRQQLDNAFERSNESQDKENLDNPALVTLARRQSAQPLFVITQPNLKRGVQLKGADNESSTSLYRSPKVEDFYKKGIPLDAPFGRVDNFSLIAREPQP